MRSYTPKKGDLKGSDLMGFVMVEQIKSIDYKARNARFIGKASDETLDTVLSILDVCIY